MSSANQPVRVTFALRTPMIVPSTDKMLDALLSNAAVEEATFNDHEDPFSVQHNIGLAKHHVGDQWCFMASNLHFEWAGEGFPHHYIKRAKLEDFVDAWDKGVLKKRPSFDASRGTTKAGSFIVPARWVHSITAFAVVEDMERFNALLPWVTHIGKLAHKDWGAVRHVSVDHDEVANTNWANRYLPAGSPCSNGHRKSIGGLASPYWLRTAHREILVPAT